MGSDKFFRVEFSNIVVYSMFAGSTMLRVTTLWTYMDCFFNILIEVLFMLLIIV
jgi:hypothetical protein